MKKLLTIFGLTFVLGLNSISAFAQTLNFDFNSDGVYDTDWELTPPPPGGDTVQVEIWLDDWDTSPWPSEPLFGVLLFFQYDDSSIQVNSVTANDSANAGPFDPGFTLIDNMGGGLYGLEVSEFNCVPITDKILLFTIELECIAAGDSDVTITTDLPNGMVAFGGSECLDWHLEKVINSTATIQQSECRNDADCWNSSWCDGIESCIAGMCVSGSPPCSDDSSDCTQDCVEADPPIESNPGTCNVCNAVGPTDPCCTDPECSGEPVCQIEFSDYYVDGTNGNNSNAGLTPLTAWKTITYALSRVSGTENNRVDINVAPSTYDTFMGGGDAETFPLMMKDYVSLLGAGQAVTEIDADQTESVVKSVQVNGFSIEGFTITGGSAPRGGGIYLSYSSPDINKCNITGNSAILLNGGGVYCQASSPVMTNCVISLNTAAQNGGGISCGRQSSPVVTNCTVVANTAGDGFEEGGGAIYCGNGSSPPVTNSILWDNYPNQVLTRDASVPSFNYCCIEGGYSGTGNVDLDPKFMGAGDYHLFFASSCIDAANSVAAPSTDIEENPRFNDLTIPDTGAGPVTYYDIGAYEYQGDVDGDGVPEDGDESATAGDSPCTGGATENCDDNCLLLPNGPDLGTCTLGTIGNPCLSNGDCGSGGFCSMQQEDSEGDGVGDACDNCPATPNGPFLGTCGRLIFGLILSTGNTICTGDADCEATDFCIMNQEDSNGNAVGNACECIADFNGDGKVGIVDLNIMKGEFGRQNCTTLDPCQADLNGDGKVSIIDLHIIKFEYSRNDCPAVP